MGLETRHLIRHQRHQRGDNHRQGAGFVIAGQCRELIAEGLARTCGQNPQPMAASHDAFHNGLLEGQSPVVCRFSAKVVEAEPAFQFLAGVMAFPTPATGGTGAGQIPQPVNPSPRFREPMAHPGRHQRVVPRHGQPCQHVGHVPAQPVCLRHNSPSLNCAGAAFEKRANSAPALAGVGSGCIA